MSERDIERVLEGLGGVEAPQGLEERVLRAMTARETARGFGWAWVGVGALVVAGVVLGGLRYKDSFNATAAAAEEQRMTHDPSARPTEVSSVKETLNKRSLERAGLQPRRKAPSIQPALAAEGMFVADGKRIQSFVKAEVAIEAGFPAPEAPLTEQERLLLRLARRPNEATIAMFDQGIREERAAAEKAEFDFLNPQRPVETEPPQETEKSQAIQQSTEKQSQETRDEVLPGK